MNINIFDAPIFERNALFEYMQTCFDIDVVPMIWGPPGCSKSQSVEHFAEMNGMTLVHRHWGQYGIHSASGIVVPDIGTRTAFFTRPDFMVECDEIVAKGGKPLFFMDEWPNADKSVAAAGNQIVDELRVGEHHFPEGTYVVTAGNGPTQGGATCVMPATASNRVANAQFNGPNVTEYCEWGEASGRLSVEVMAYLQRNPHQMYDFDKSRVINNTHRTWEMASRMFDRRRNAGLSIMAGDFIAMLSTVVMRTTAVDMAVTIALADKITPIAEILSDPANALLPHERDGIASSDALAANFMQMRLCVAAMGSDTKVSTAICTYIARMSREMRAAFSSMAMRRYKLGEMTMGSLNCCMKAFKDDLTAVIDRVQE